MKWFFLHCLANQDKNVRFLKLSLKPCSHFRNFKSRKGNFSNLVTMCLHIKVYIERLKVYEKFSPEVINLSKWFFLYRVATKYKNVRLLKLSQKPCSLFHNFKLRKGDFSNLVAMCLHIKVYIERVKVYEKISFKVIKLSSLKPCSLFHNFKSRKGDFRNLVVMCLHIKVYIKPLNIKEKIFQEQIKLLKWFFFASSSKEV